jgi:Fe-S-cluster containining protein
MVGDAKEIVNNAASNHQSPLTSTQSLPCLQCGTCCVAPDISTLGKPVGDRCRHLADDLSCSIYPQRPAVCRGYCPDEICQQIAAPTLAERVQNYQDIFAGCYSGNVLSEKVPADNSA